jgi:hypothetical protein
MQISAKQKLIRLAAGSMFAAGTVLIPGAVASAETPILPSKAPHPLPDEVPTDPAEGLPVPVPGHGR